MNSFIRKLITEWRRLELPFKGETVVVAVSGGADSTALLLALADLQELNKLEHDFIVAHFNHKLRGRESDEDETFVKGLAADIKLKFTAGKGKTIEKSNLEETARNARYDFLETVAKKHRSKLVLTGHTLDDQAETILMNLIRGSGIDGLAGTQKVRTLVSNSEILLIRPLLGWAKRSDTEIYCREHKVEPRTDRMNKDPRFTRVRVRNEVIPLLAELNPNIVETIARTGDLLRHQIQSVESDLPNTLSLKELRNLDASAFRSIIRAWLRQKRGNLRGLQLKHIEAVERLVHSPKSGRIAELPGGAAVVKSGGRLAFRDNKLEN